MLPKEWRLDLGVLLGRLRPFDQRHQLPPDAADQSPCGSGSRSAPTDTAVGCSVAAVRLALPAAADQPPRGSGPLSAPADTASGAAESAG